MENKRNGLDSKNIQVSETSFEHIEDQEIELVERKGIGHPDSLADGISEAVSRALCKRYMEEFGTIAHHNTDEVQIIGGKSNPKFGGGNIVKPIYVLLGGRATQEYGSDSINVHGIALDAAKDYLDSAVRNLDVEEEVILDSRIGEGSPDLTDMYARKEKVPLANDTSFGIGHAPFSETEKTVLRLARHLNSREFEKSMPAIGEDVKVMGYRNKDKIELTVAAAFVDRFVDDLDSYISLKSQLRNRILDKAVKYTDRDIELHINTADSPEDESVYLTVTGTSAEMGDDGSTGRGNRVSGLITPKRSMSLEASSGKNPVSHIGKIYNILSHYIADQIVAEYEEVESVHVKILSQIGKPIDHPQIASIDVSTSGKLGRSLKRDIEETAGYWLENINQVMDKVVEGEITTF
ncbi:MAG: methionine adenosyltransferase [Candidatus Nanohaloarchaea archaeon]|nr:methionine adenosyltransferase [Candidatus Nanohaloarchaea archaeon]